MEYFVQQLVNGLTLGSIYGLIAIGYTMVYGIIGMINFAHGDIFMIGAFIALIVFLFLVSVFGSVPVVLFLLIMMIVAMLLTSLYNWTIEKVAYRPLRGSFRLAPLITAIGMSIALSNFVQVTQGPRNKPIPPMISTVYNIFGISISLKQIVIVVGDRRPADALLVPRQQDVARPRPAGLRAGPQDGGAARRRRRPHHLDHLHHGRFARRRRRHALPDVLRRRRPSPTASCRA